MEPVETLWTELEVIIEISNSSVVIDAKKI